MSEQVRVFVSHHHSPDEDEFTAKLVHDLETAGADVWIDEKGVASGSFVAKISEGLEGRQWLIVVMTPDALRSPWVRSEVETGIAEHTAGRMRGVLPIVLQPCDENDIPVLWRKFHRYLVTKDYVTARDGILSAMDLPVPAKPASPPAPVLPGPARGAPIPASAQQAPMPSLIAPTAQPIVPSPYTPSRVPIPQMPPVQPLNSIGQVPQAAPPAYPLPQQSYPGYPVPQQPYPGYPAQAPVPPRKAGMTATHIAVLVILVVAIIGGGIYFVISTHSAGSINVAGNWSITLSITTSTGTATLTVPFTATMTLAQNGNSVTGSLIPGGGQPNEAFSGSISGKSITLNVTESSDTVRFEGTITDASHMSGSFTATNLDGSRAGNGTWSATKP